MANGVSSPSPKSSVVLSAFYFLTDVWWRSSYALHSSNWTSLTPSSARFFCQATVPPTSTACWLEVPTARHATNLNGAKNHHHRHQSTTIQRWLTFKGFPFVSFECLWLKNPLKLARLDQRNGETHSRLRRWVDSLNVLGIPGERFWRSRFFSYSCRSFFRRPFRVFCLLGDGGRSWFGFLAPV